MYYVLLLKLLNYTSWYICTLYSGWEDLQHHFNTTWKRNCGTKSLLSILFRARFIFLVRELSNREAQDSCHPCQLAQLLPRHVEAGENAHCAHVLPHAIYQLNVSGARGHVLVPKELVTDQQGVNGHGFIGLLHVFQAIKSPVRLVLQHFIEVI